MSTAVTGLRPVTPLSILVARLDALRARLTAGAVVDQQSLDEVAALHTLAAAVDPYLEACSTPASPALQELARRTREADWTTHGSATLEAEMLSGHVEGQFLRMLVRLCKAQRVLEIGMFTGYSALAMAEALPADGSLVACEIDQAAADFAVECFRASPHGFKIDVRVGPALATLAALASAGERFELVFIDADKPSYAAYLDALLDLDLLAPDGLICVDNTLMQGEAWASEPATENGRALALFNQRVVADPRVEQVLLPLRDGLTLISRVAEAVATSSSR